MVFGEKGRAKPGGGLVAEAGPTQNCPSKASLHILLPLWRCRLLRHPRPSPAPGHASGGTAATAPPRARSSASGATRTTATSPTQWSPGRRRRWRPLAAAAAGTLPGPRCGGSAACSCAPAASARRPWVAVFRALWRPILAHKIKLPESDPQRSHSEVVEKLPKSCDRFLPSSTQVAPVLAKFGRCRPNSADFD